MSTPPLGSHPLLGVSRVLIVLNDITHFQEYPFVAVHQLLAASVGSFQDCSHACVAQARVGCPEAPVQRSSPGEYCAGQGLRVQNVVRGPSSSCR